MLYLKSHVLRAPDLTGRVQGGVPRNRGPEKNITKDKAVTAAAVLPYFSPVILKVNCPEGQEKVTWAIGYFLIAQKVTRPAGRNLREYKLYFLLSVRTTKSCRYPNSSPRRP